MKFHEFKSNMNKSLTDVDLDEAKYSKEYADPKAFTKEDKEYAVTFQKGEKVGARSISIIRVTAKNDDDAYKKASKDPRAKGKKMVDIKIDEDFRLDEAKYSSSKLSNYPDYTVVAIKNGKVVDQLHSVAKNEFKDVINFLKKENPGAKISIEDKGGKIIHTEGLDEVKKGTKWEYEDATGVKRIGVLDKFSDKGGTDITYFFKRVKDGRLDVVSGSRLKKAKIVKEEAELDEGIIDQVKDIASKKSAAKIGGVMVDSFTASAISQIYDKVNDANKKKMEKLPITKLADLAFKMMSKD